MEKGKVKKLFWSIVVFAPTILIGGEMIVKHGDAFASVKQNLRNKPNPETVDLSSARLGQNCHTILIPQLKPRSDADGLAPEEWFNNASEKAKERIMLNCFDLNGSSDRQLQAQMITNFHFSKLDGNRFHLDIFLHDPDYFSDNSQYQSWTFSLTNVKTLPVIKKSTLVSAVDLRGECTIDQCVSHKQGEKPTENIDDKFNNLFSDQDSLLLGQSAPISITKVPSQEATISVQSTLTSDKFSDQSTQTSATTKLENAIIGDVSFKNSTDVNQQTLTSWIFFVNQNINDAIGVLTSDPTSLPVQVAEKNLVSKKTDQSITALIQLKNDFVSKHKQSTLSNEVTLTKLAKTITKPTLKDSIDLKMEQTVDQWIASENKKTISEKIADLFVSTEVTSLVDEIKTIELNRKANGQVEVVVELREAYLFDDGTRKISLEVNPINWKTAPTFAAKFIPVIIAGAIVLMLTILGISISMPIRRQRKINSLRYRLDEQRLARLSVESELASQQILRAAGAIGEKVATVSEQLNGVKKNSTLFQADNQQLVTSHKSTHVVNHSPQKT